MRSILHIARVSAAVIAISLAGIASAQAQPGAPSATRIAGRGTSQPALDRALRELGYNPGTLRRDQVRAIDEAWVRLFPEANRYRYALNPTQATALVYVALAHERDPRGGYGRGDGYGRNDGDRRGGMDDDRNGGGGRDDDGRYERGGSDDDRYGRGNGQCVDVNRSVYDVENAVNVNGSMFLDDGQKREVRTAAREVQRLAVERGWRRVADSASQVIASTAEALPNRSTLVDRVQGLKRAVDESCGQSSGRGGYVRP